ncbi:hypothetical protein [Spiroplasma eriocheiris]|uniref:hypothetical protein n=1 Tax=Spiroplasma eriocheiris TaxID=315358 RepID=UPI00064B783D|nr:hypothetical protein [Spiroplasma eriocheiris]
MAGTDTFLESAGQCAKSNGAQWIAITSVSDSVFQNADQLIVLESKEWNIWNLYSLRGQMLFEFWNVVYLATVHKMMEAENYEKAFDSYQETDDLSNLKIKI